MIVDGIVGSYLKGIPWPLVPAKRLFQNRKVINVGLKEKNRLALTMSGVIRRKLDDLEGLQSSDYSTYQIFDKDDLVFKLIDLENIKTSRVGIVPERGIMSPAYIRLVPASESVYPKFYYWYFFGFYLNNIFNKLGAGIRQNLASGDLLLQPVPELCYQDQMRIAQYIDNNVNRINGLIQEKQNFINLLKEKRQALISHVVTKGLDPDVEMKDSGVEWLGQIPKHWTLKKFKHVGKAVIGLTYKPDNTVDDGGTIVLRSTNIQNSRIKLHDVVRVNSEIPEKLRTKKGDILICSRNGSRRLIGKNAMIDSASSGLSFGAFTTVFRSEINDFIYYILNSELFNYQAGMFMTTTVNQLTTGMLNNFEFPMPPESEAMEIVSNLSRRVPRIDALIGEVQSSIKLLEEHRTSLISAAVTGKIDLRDKEVA